MTQSVGGILMRIGLLSLFSLSLIALTPAMSRADELAFEICSVGSGYFGYRCKPSTLQNGKHTVFVNLVDDAGRAVASFHTLGVRKLSTGADVDFQYSCLFHNANTNRDDPPQTQQSGV